MAAKILLNFYNFFLGIVKYIGPLPDRSDIYFGLELDAEGIDFLIKFLNREKKNKANRISRRGQLKS